MAVTDLMAAYILPPILKDLRQAAPGIEINLKCSNSISDLRRREADIAIRHVRPEHPELFARKLRDTPARIYASKALLEAYGGAIALQDIPKFDFLGFGNNEELVIGLHGMGLPIRAENIKLGSPSALVVWHLVRSGLGLSVMADEIASKCPDVACALPDLDPVFFPIWLVTHRELHTSRKIRLVFDHLSSELKRHWP